MNIELSQQELSIVTQGLKVLHDNCEKVNQIIVHDKIDLEPIQKLMAKLAGKTKNKL